jgi:hypothetical protein
MKYLTLMIRRNISSTNRIDIDPPLGLDRAVAWLSGAFSRLLPFLFNARDGQMQFVRGFVAGHGFA